MVIITNSSNAVMFYSESQYLDAEDCTFCDNAWGFRVPNSTPNSEILGTYPSIDPITGEGTPGTPPMTQSAVVAISTEVLFEPAPERGVVEVRNQG